MRDYFPCDEQLIQRLPLPLARIYRHAHNALLKSPLECHQAAYFLWEASLKLMASTALAVYAEQPDLDPRIASRLKKLARPAQGHWWEFVRLLVPVLAGSGDPGFCKLQESLFGAARDRESAPRIAELGTILSALARLGGEDLGRVPLGSAMVQAIDEAKGRVQQKTRLDAIFDRIVNYRNEALGHGAVGMARPEYYEPMSRALLSAATELFQKVDILAGRKLLFVEDVRRQPDDGRWLVIRFELMGETRRLVEPLFLPEAYGSAEIPYTGRIYLDHAPAGEDPRVADASRRFPSPTVHPLLIYDAVQDDVYFLNSRQDEQRIDYLSYIHAGHAGKIDLSRERRDLLSRLLGSPVTDSQISEWTAEAREEERKADAPGQVQASGLPPGDEATGSSRLRFGEFELLSELGRGRMGVVYRALQRSLGRQVALKTSLKPGDPKAEERLLRECRALARVAHPNLVKFFSYGTEEERCFFAMELVEGATLGAICDWLHRRSPNPRDVDSAVWQESVRSACNEARAREKPLGGRPDIPRADPPAEPRATAPATVGTPPGGGGYVRQVVELMRQTALAAHALHAAGVIHRDIKPENVLITADGSQAVLTDLGLAQLVDDETRSKVSVTRVVGTPRYASPEQVIGLGGVDHRSDIYSLGATLWELLTLHPFLDITDETPVPRATILITSKEPNRIRKHHGEISHDLEVIVGKCLEKDPTCRYDTSADLAEDLGRWLQDRPVRARPPSRLYVAGKFVRRNRFALSVAAAVLVVISVSLVVGIIGWVQGRVADSERKVVKARNERIEADYKRIDADNKRIEAERRLKTAENASLRDRQRAADQKEYRGNLRLAHTFLQTGRVGEAREMLRRAQSQLAKVREPRGFEHNYLYHLAHSTSPTTLGGHVGGVNALAYSPDGKTLAVAARGNQHLPSARLLGQAKASEVRLWDLGLRQVRAVLPGMGGQFLAMAFSPDGATIATAEDGPGGEGMVRLWAADSGQGIRILNGGRARTGVPSGGKRSVVGLAYSPDGKSMVVAYRDGTASLWDVAQDREIRTYTDAIDEVNGVAFSPDGSTYALGCSAHAVVLDTASGRERVYAYLEHGGTKCVAYSPGGKTLVAGGIGGPLCLIDVATGQIQARFLSDSSMAVASVFSPDGNLLATSGMGATIQIWDANTGQERAKLSGLWDSTVALAFSPDGATLASGDSVGLVHLWDPYSGQDAESARGVTSVVRALAFSPGGSTLAAGGGVAPPSDQPELKVWDAPEARLRTAVQQAPPRYTSVAFSRDGKWLVAGEDPADPALPGVLTLWDVEKRSVHARFRGAPLGSIASVALSPDGKILATGSGTSLLVQPLSQPAYVTLWDVETATVRTTLRGHVGAVAWLAISPDGKTLATSGMRISNPPEPADVRLWDLETGRQRGEIKGHEAHAAPLVFSPDGKTLALGAVNLLPQGRPGRVTLWDPATGKPKEPAFPVVSGGALSIAFTTDGATLATGGTDGSVRLWDAAAGELRRALAGHGVARPKHLILVHSLAFGHEGRTLVSSAQVLDRQASETGSADIRFWETATGKERPEPIRGSMGSAFIAASPDGKTLATASNDGILKLWDMTRARDAATLQGPAPDDEWRHRRTITCLAYSPNGKTLATGSADKTVRIWDLGTARAHMLGEVHAAPILALAFSPDGRMLASGTGELTDPRPGEIRLWDVATGRELGPALPSHGPVTGLVFADQGKALISGHASLRDLSYTGEVRSWNLETRTPSYSFSGPQMASVQSIALSPDGKTLAVGNNVNLVTLWDLPTRRQLRTLRGHLGQVHAIAFSRDGTILATGSEDRAVKVWEVASGDELLTLRGHPDAVRALAFSPDGTTLATGGPQVLRGAIKLWRAPKGNIVLTTYYDQRLDGISKGVDTYDARGDRIEVAFFDNSGVPQPNLNAVPRIRYAYDDTGREIEELYLDKNGQPVPNRHGALRIEASYKEGGGRTVTTTFALGATGRSALYDPDVAKLVEHYDERERFQWGVFSGSDARPRVHRVHGYAKVSVNYLGDLSERLYTDAEDRPIATRVVVKRIVPGSQAESRGLKPGDVLVSYDGQELSTMARFIAGRRAEKPTETSKILTILRGGKSEEIQVAPGQLGAELNDQIVPR